jgi:hypothetical protein
MSLSAAGRWLAGFGLLPAFVCAGASAVWLDVPFVKHEANGCGAVSIAMLMRYWSESDADPHRIYQALYSREAQGIRGGDVERFLRTASAANSSTLSSISLKGGR